MAGVSAAYLAADGFTGAPAATVEMPEVSHLWEDLHSTWHMLDQLRETLSGVPLGPTVC